MDKKNLTEQQKNMPSRNFVSYFFFFGFLSSSCLGISSVLFTRRVFFISCFRVFVFADKSDKQIFQIHKQTNKQITVNKSCYSETYPFSFFFFCRYLHLIDSILLPHYHFSKFCSSILIFITLTYIVKILLDL